MTKSSANYTRVCSLLYKSLFFESRMKHQIFIEQWTVPPFAGEIEQRSRIEKVPPNITFFQTSAVWIWRGTVMLITEGANFSFTGPTKTSPLHASWFNKSPKLVVTDLQDLYTWISSIYHATFQSFIHVSGEVLQGTWQSLRALFLNNMLLFDYNLKDNGKRLVKKAASWQKRMTIWV